VDKAKKIGGSKTDSIFSRYNIISEEALQDGGERVSKYNEAGGQKVASIAR
jgi:hypothetical protein